MQYIGLSLSMCIQDLVKGRLGNNAQVLVIVAGTNFNQDNLFEEAYEHYSKGYWNTNPKEAYKSAFDSVKVIQPRTYGQEAPKISHGYWVKLPLHN